MKKVTQPVNQKVTQQVTQKVTQPVTQQIIQPVIHQRITASVSKFGIMIDGASEDVKIEMIKEYTIEVPVNSFGMNRGATKYIPAPDIVNVCYLNGNGKLVLPRNAIMNPKINSRLAGITVDNSAGFGADLSPNRKFEIELFGNQALIVDYIMKNHFSDNRRASNMATALLQLGTGYGKTYVGAAIIHKIGKKTLWVLPNTSILEQTAEVLEVAFPNLNIGKYFSEQKDDPAEFDVIMILVDSLVAIEKSGKCTTSCHEINPKTGRPRKAKREYSIVDWISHFGLTVYDEIHMYTGPIYSTIFWFFSAPVVFAMSATVNQNNKKLDTIYKMHFGNEIISADLPGFEKNDLAWKRRLVHIKYYGKDPYIQPVLFNGNLNFSKTVTELIKDPVRNNMTIDLVEEALAAGHSVFVFTEYRHHATLLAKMFAERHKNTNRASSDDADEFSMNSNAMLPKQRTETGIGIGTGTELKQITHTIHTMPNINKNTDGDVNYLLNIAGAENKNVSDSISVNAMPKGSDSISANAFPKGSISVNSASNNSISANALPKGSVDEMVNTLNKLAPNDPVFNLINNIIDMKIIENKITDKLLKKLEKAEFDSERRVVGNLGSLQAEFDSERIVIGNQGPLQDEKMMVIGNQEPEGPKTTVLMGGASEIEVEDARTTSKVIFTTYSYTAVGVSIVRMSALILASPRKSGLEQITGRIERRGGDVNLERVVYDIVDQLSPLSRQFKVRKHVYKHKEYTFEERKTGAW